MARLALLFFVAGLYLIGSGCYDLFVQAGTSRQPTTVSVAELEKSVPANRHLVVTGGQPVKETAVTFYKTKWGTKVSGSEILFIPITDASTAAPNRSTPSILLRVTADQIEAAKAGNKIDFHALEGVRTTSMDLEDKARRRLVEAYGQAAVDRMIILNYHGTVGMGSGLAKLAGGVALAGALAGADQSGQSFHSGRIGSFADAGNFGQGSRSRRCCGKGRHGGQGSLDLGLERRNPWPGSGGAWCLAGNEGQH